MKGHRMKILTGPEVDRSRAAAAPVLDRVCAAAGRPRPRLLIVDRLTGIAGEAGQGTAKAVFRGGPGIMLPATLVDKLTPAAFEYLMAHELGHITLNRSRWALAWTMAVVLFLAGIVCAFGLMGLMIARGLPPGLGLALSGVFVALLGVLALMAYINRHQEYEADLFAARLQGNLQGARELMEHNTRLRAMYSSKPGKLSRMLATHPEPAQRLAYLQRTFRDDERPAAG